MPTVTSVSVTARPVVLTAEVAGTSAHDVRGNSDSAGSATAPLSNLRRNGDIRPRLLSSDMSTPSGSKDLVTGQTRMARNCATHSYARSRILHRKIAT